MAKNKKRSHSTRSGTRPHPSPRSGIRRPMTLLGVGLALAVAIALYLSYTPGLTTSAVDSTFLNAAVGGHVRGADDASITLTEYGDFECPTCADFHPIVTELLRRMPDELELEFHHFPLPVGPNSVTAALAAEAAAEQGRYWDMHDALFGTQRQWSGQDDAIDLFTSMAAQLGLDANRFAADLRSPELQSRIVADRQQGTALGVTGTPAFFVNGQRLNGLPQTIDQFEAILRTVIIR